MAKLTPIFPSTVSMRHFVLPLVYCILISAATALRSGKLPKSFVESPDNPPPWQYHAYNNNTYILRQSGFTDYEKPFLYMLFGEEKVFLLDTGSRWVLYHSNGGENGTISVSS